MWRNGYAPVCKTVYSGSIPDVASINSVNNLACPTRNDPGTTAMRVTESGTTVAY